MHISVNAIESIKIRYVEDFPVSDIVDDFVLRQWFKLSRIYQCRGAVRGLGAHLSPLSLDQFMGHPLSNSSPERELVKSR